MRRSTSSQSQIRGIPLGRAWGNWSIFYKAQLAVRCRGGRVCEYSFPGLQASSVFNVAGASQTEGNLSRYVTPCPSFRGASSSLAKAEDLGAGGPALDQPGTSLLHQSSRCPALAPALTPALTPANPPSCLVPLVPPRYLKLGSNHCFCAFRAIVIITSKGWPGVR